MRALPLLLLAASARAEDVPVFVGGKESASVYVYKVGEQRYLDAKQAVSAYGGNFVWQAVSGKVQLSVRGRRAQLKVGSPRARIVDGGIDLPVPVIVRANTVLVPLEFFSSEEFGKMSWAKTRFDAAHGRLEITARSSVGPMRWHSYKDHTRVVAELDPAHVWSLSRRGRSSLDVTIPLGSVETAQEASLKDGIVDNLRLRQESKRARLTIELAETAPKAVWDARLFSDPRRLVIDVYPDAAAMDNAVEARQAKAKPVRGEAGDPDSPSERRHGGAPPRQATAPQDAPAASPPASAVPAVALAPPAPPKAAGGAGFPAVVSRRPVSSASIRPLRKIVIDPGHGGIDSGATGRRGALEKNINLLAAKELAKRLREAGTFEVMLTRDRDVFVPLAERSRMANEFGADLFVSLHCNANRHRGERGFEIYFLSERASDPEAERVAERENASLALETGGGGADAEAALLLHALARTEYINDASIAAGIMSKALARRVSIGDRGVKQAAFYVLRGTSAPAVLVEMGFVSNAAEEALLKSKRSRSKLVDGLFAGIVDFAKRQDWIGSSR